MGVEDEDLVAAGACPWVRGLIATVLVTGWDGQDRERAGRAAVLSRVLWGVLSGPPVVVPPVERAEAWGAVEDVAGLVGLLGSCPGGLGVVEQCIARHCSTRLIFLTKYSSCTTKMSTSVFVHS